MESIQQLKALFPEVVTDGKIDFDKLRTALGGAADTTHEQTWRLVASNARCLLWYADIQEVGDPHRLGWDLHIVDEAAARRFLPLDQVSPDEPYLAAWNRSRGEGRELSDEYAASEIRANRSYSREFPCRLKGGVVRWLQEDVQVEPLAPNRWRAVGVCTDITARKQVEDALRSAQQEAVDVLESISDAFYAVDEQWRFTYINRKAELLWGMRRDELQGRNLWEAFPQSVGGTLYEEMHRAARERQAIALEMFSIVMGRWIEVNIYPGPRGLSVYFRDISERKQAEQEKARLLAEVREAAVRQRLFLREVLAGVTEGRLRLCDTESDLPPVLSPIEPPVLLTKSSLRTLRHQAEAVAKRNGFAVVRWQDLVAAVGEAAMNAVVHAGSGEGHVGSGPDGTVQVWIQDSGTGIAVERLHRATLTPGFSTAGSLGHGFWMMLKTADRIWLLTGPSGTTVVLEQDREAPEPDWFRDSVTYQ